MKFNRNFILLILAITLFGFTALAAYTALPVVMGYPDGGYRAAMAGDIYLNMDQVDNTHDINKPVSVAQQLAINNAISSLQTTLTAAIATVQSSVPAAQIADDWNEATTSAADYIKNKPVALPPNGAAGGDLTLNYPNPILNVSGVTAGTYKYPTITFDAKGRATSAVSSARIFQYPGAGGNNSAGNPNPAARALNTCFQISATQDASFLYGINSSALITLGGATGLITSYTNSGCTTGAQSLADGSVSGVAVGGTSSIPLSGTLQANHWAKITGTATGGSTNTLSAVQSETLQP